MRLSIFDTIDSTLALLDERMICIMNWSSS